MLATLVALDGAPAAIAETAETAEKPARVGRITIQHEPVRCILAERYPVVEACFVPAPTVAQARVEFRAEGESKWHFVPMEIGGKCYRAALPPPRADTPRIHYRIAAFDYWDKESRSAESVADVVTEEQRCPNGVAAPLLSSAPVSVGGGGHPAGFVGGKRLGGAKIVGLAAVVGGSAAAAAMLAGGEDTSPSDTGGTGRDAQSQARESVFRVDSTWASELTLAGGKGQVIANGADVAFVDAGRAELPLQRKTGANRIEAVVVDARGRPGVWRFTSEVGPIRPGTLRVVAGDVLTLGADTITFRLRGRPGERVVFAFEGE